MAGLFKAALYRDYRDKDALLVHIADGHVSRRQALAPMVADLFLGGLPAVRVPVPAAQAVS